MDSPGSSAQQKHPLLSNGPLYAFALPQELLQVLALRSPLGGHSAVGSTNSNGDAAKDEPPSSTVNGAVSALGCSLCHVQTFESLPEQRSHFSSDWHRYNVKRKLANKSAVRENEWEGLVEGSSISQCRESQLETYFSVALFIQHLVTRSLDQPRPVVTTCRAQKTMKQPSLVY